MEELFKALYGKYAVNLSPEEVNKKIKYALTLDPNEAVDKFYLKYTGALPTNQQKTAASNIVKKSISNFEKTQKPKERPNVWESIGIGIKNVYKGFAASGPMMQAGRELTKINKKINQINNSPDVQEFSVGGYFSQKEGFTIGAEKMDRASALDYYKKEKARQEAIWLENFSQAEEIQEKIDRYERARVFAEDGSFDLDAQEVFQIGGEQLPQMLGSLFGGTYFQEAGNVMDELVDKKAAEDLNVSYEEFLQLPKEERAKAALNVINDGRAEDILDTAHKVGLINQTLDFTSNVFLVGRAAKFIPKSAFRSALKGKYKELGQLAKDRILKPQFFEVLTENAQEMVSAYNTDNPITYELLRETTAQTIIGTGTVQTSISGVNYSYNEGMAEFAALTDPTSVRAVSNEMRKQIKNDKRRTNDQNTLDLLRQIDIAESLTKNSEYNNLSPEARTEFFKQEVARQKQFDQIQNFETKLEKNPENLQLEYEINEAKSKLDAIENNMANILYYNNYVANGQKFAEYINSSRKGFFADKNIIIRDNKEELQQYIKNTNPELLNDKSIQNLIDGTSNGVLSKDGKTAYIINDNIKNNALKRTEGTGRDAGNVIHHEVMHMLFNGMNDNTRVEIKNEIDQTLKESTDPEIQQIYNDLQDRLEVYKDSNEYIISNEFFSGLSDVLSPIQALKNIEQVSLFNKIGNAFSKNISKNILNIPININGENALALMQKYNSFNGVETSLGQVAEQVAGDIVDVSTKGGVDIKESLESKEAMSQALDKYITDDIQTQDDFQKNDIARAGVYTEIEVNNVLDGYISNMIAIDKQVGSLAPQIQEDIKRQVKERITDRIFKNFDPNKEGNRRSLFSYIYGKEEAKGSGGIAYVSLLDIKKKYVEAPKTTGIERKVGGEIQTIQVIDEGISIDEQLDQKILSENIDDTKNPKIENEVNILGQNDIKDIDNFINEIFPEKEVLVDPEDPNFRNKILDVYEKAVMPKIRKLAGAFDKFFEKYIPKLHDPKKKLLPIQYLYQAERSQADKKFAKFDKRLTKQDDIRKARDNKEAYVENEAQGVDRYNRLQTPEEYLKEFYGYGLKGKDITTTIRARRNKLYATLGGQYLLNRTPEIIKKSALSDQQKGLATKKLELSLESRDNKKLANKLKLDNFWFDITDTNSAVQYAQLMRTNILPEFKKYPGLLKLGTLYNGHGVFNLFKGKENSAKRKEIREAIQKELLKDNNWVKKGVGYVYGQDKNNVYATTKFDTSSLKNILKIKSDNRKNNIAFIHGWRALNAAIKNNKENIIPILHFLENAVSEGDHFHRKGAELIGFDIAALNRGERLYFEHALQNANAFRFLTEEAFNDNINFIDSLEALMKNYKLIAISKKDNDKLNTATYIDVNGKQVSYKDNMGRNWNVFNSSWLERYANKAVAAIDGGFNFKNIQTLDGVTFEKHFNIKNDGTAFDVALESKDINLSQDFNDIIEQKKGAKFASNKRFSIKKGKRRGRGKGMFNFFIPHGAEDFQGLMYATLPKGELGNKAMEWMRQNLFRPYNIAMENITRERIAIMNDFVALKNQLKNVPKTLKKEILEGDYTNQDAVRVWIWTRQGMQVPGLTKTDQKKLVDVVNKNKDLLEFATQLININKGDGYVKPDNNWDVGTITTDLLQNINTTKRVKHLAKWQKNVEEIFGKFSNNKIEGPNMNKLEAAYGTDYRIALENVLRRMRSGRNRPGGGDQQVDAWLEWINNSVGVIMFLNVRSAVLQMISTINYMNWSDNNPLQAAKAYANPQQFWSDFKFIYNSDFLTERRGGLKLNVNESEIAEQASKRGVRGVISMLLNKGFVLTRAADSFAIANGGAAFYRNRINSYLKEGKSQQEAETQAFLDFKSLTEEAQQSSRPDRISKEQASVFGRVILAFANTPMQYARLMKRSAQDIANKRGDWKTNWSKLIYYSAVQNFIFNALQQALFAIGFGEDDEEEVDKKITNVTNNMLDSILRGTGVAGNVVMVGKNIAIDMAKRAQKPRPNFKDGLWKLFDISPPIDAKITKLRSAAYVVDNQMDEVLDEGLSLDNPANMAAAQTISATTNIPLDRALRLFDNYRAAVSSDSEAWQKVALALGWSTWELGMQKNAEGLKIENKKFKHSKLKLKPQLKLKSQKLKLK